MYRFLVDEDSPKGLYKLLVNHGFDAVHVVDAGLSGTKDPQLAQWAKRDNRIIVTRDLGFANLLNYPIGSLPGVILIRVPDNYLASEIIGLFSRFLPFLEKDVRELNLSGALVVLEPSHVRIRTVGS
jgi:predicted nuclease of predicted toxin-antitoxin system